MRIKDQYSIARIGAGRNAEKEEKALCEASGPIVVGSLQRQQPWEVVYPGQENVPKLDSSSLIIKPAVPSPDYPPEYIVLLHGLYSKAWEGGYRVGQLDVNKIRDFKFPGSPPDKKEFEKVLRLLRSFEDLKALRIKQIKLLEEFNYAVVHRVVVQGKLLRGSGILDAASKLV